MKKYFTLKNGVGGVLMLWILFSVGYIFRDQFNKYQYKAISNAYQAGVTESIDQLIEQAKQCQPVKVYKDNDEVNLISIDCLRAPATDEGTNED